MGCSLEVPSELLWREPGLSVGWFPVSGPHSQSGWGSACAPDTGVSCYELSPLHPVRKAGTVPAHQREIRGPLGTIQLENQGQIRAASPVLLHQAGEIQGGPVSPKVSPHARIATASPTAHAGTRARAHSHEPPRPAHSQSADSGGGKAKRPEPAWVLSEALSPSALWAQPHSGQSGFRTGVPARRPVDASAARAAPASPWRGGHGREQALPALPPPWAPPVRDGPATVRFLPVLVQP